MLLLAREIAPVLFGEFVLVYTGFLLVHSFQASLITQPHNVIGVRYGSDEYRTYTSTCLWAELAFCAAVAAGFVLLGAAMSLWRQSLAELLFVMAFAAPAWLLQDFFRRVMYTEARPKSAFRNDLLSYGGQAVTLVALWLFGVLEPIAAILVLGGTSVAGAALGVWQIKASLNGSYDPAFLRENWAFSRWLVGGTASYWLSTQSYRYMVALLIGPAATATLAAVEILLRPIGVLNMYLETALPNYFSRRLHATSRVQLMRLLQPVLIASLPVLFYALLMLGVGERVLRIAFAGTYQDEVLLIALMSLYYLLSFAGTILSAALRALRATDTLFYASVAASAVTLTLGWGLIELFSMEGAVLGTILNGTMFALIAGRRLRQETAA